MLIFCLINGNVGIWLSERFFRQVKRNRIFFSPAALSALYQAQQVNRSGTFYKDSNMNDFKLKHVRTGRVFYINKPIATIGRDIACDVVLALGYPSRRHATISDRDGVLVLEDLNSTNGTFVNERRITNPTILRSGDVIKFSTEAFCLLDVGLQSKSIVSGKLSSRTSDNADNKVSRNFNDTIIH